MKIRGKAKRQAKKIRISHPPTESRLRRYLPEDVDDPRTGLDEAVPIDMIYTLFLVLVAQLESVTRRWTAVMAMMIRKKTRVMAEAYPISCCWNPDLTASNTTVVVESLGPPWVMTLI